MEFHYSCAANAGRNDSVADELECSEYEVQKDARLFLDKEELEHVAEILGVTVNALFCTML